MSKKQQTLFQSWQNGTKTTEPSLSRKTTSNEDLMVIDSDEDDDLLRKALEESLRDYESNCKTNVPSLSHSLSTSGYSTETPTSTLEEHLPGFDIASGNTWFYPTNKPIRKYQRDIVETSLFHNTLVTLPTGLGKTFIAAVVMYNFFRWYPRGKIIFMAPTKPLVAQQIQACYEIMGIPLDATSEMTGAMSPADRKKQWQEKRVFFLTPQILTNDISRAACPANEVKCLVLDEAHKALGNYAYVQVVQELCKHGAIFRILALSATPGSDLKAIQQVIVNLRISKIEVRNEDSPDIVPYCHSRKIDKVVVPLGPEITQVRDAFLNIFGVCARRLMEAGVLFSKDIGSLTKYMLLQSRDKFRQNPPDNFPRNRSGMIEGDFALCITLTHALELLLQHGIRGFYNFLAGKTDVVDGETGHNRTRTELLKVNGFSQMMEDLKSKFGNGCQVGSAVSHPKLTKLKEIVLEHFQQAEKENRQTRVMIFSQYRDSVNEIVALLEEYAPLIKAMNFVGHGNNTTGVKTKGFTQADQIRVIKQFTEGNYNTLVSTCVGEEGLDIGDVDMIICYDVHKSPVRLVQRCGRTGRKRDGRIVMLMTEGKEEHVHNQSVYQKKNLLKNIADNPKLKEFLLSQEPRLIPRHLSPKCHEMPMHVTTAFPPPTSRPRKSNVPSASSNVVAGRKSKTTKCYYLSDTEMDYWAQNFQTNQPVPVLPELNANDSNNDGLDGKPKLSLDKWLPWQCTLQPYHTVGHSTLTKHYVNILEHIQSHRENSHENHQQQLQMDTSEIGANAISSPPLDNRSDVLSPNIGQTFSRTPQALSSTVHHSGLYSQDFLDLFQRVPVGIDCVDIPSPPPFCFDVSTETSTLGTTSFSKPYRKPFEILPDLSAPVSKKSTVNHIWAKGMSSDRSQWQTVQINASINDITAARLPFVAPFASTNSVRKPAEACRTYMESNVNETIAMQTPPKSELETSTFCLEPSPILSQRRKKGPVKRSLEWAAAAPAKRLRMDGNANEHDWQRNQVEVVKNRVTEEEKPDVPKISVHDQSVLSVTQIVDLFHTYDEPANEANATKNILPNFELEVDFLDSFSPLPDSPKSVKQEVTTTALITPLKTKQGPSLLTESPVFDFLENTPSPSPARPKSKVSIQLGVTSEFKVQNRKPSVVPEVNFSLDFPDSWDDEDVLAPSPVPPPAQPKVKLQQPTKPVPASVHVQLSPLNRTVTIDLKSAWDKGFELNLSDLEDIELVEQAYEKQRTATKTGNLITEPKIENTKTVTNNNDPQKIMPAPNVKDSSGIRRELDDIFGPEIDDDSIEVVEKPPPVKPVKPPVFIIESDEDVVEATPPKQIPDISEITPLRPINERITTMTSDEDSPLVCRKLNSKRNPLMTQSTPVAQKTESSFRPKPLIKQSKQAACAFLDEEAELSLVEGSCSGDELEETNNGDGYEGSFVDDLGTQAVNETMRAVYLESVKSPVAQQGFVFRQPARQMNRSEIFSQAVVEQDSEYAFDSFCVDSDDAEKLEKTTKDKSPLTQLPTRAARIRAQRIQLNRQRSTSAVVRPRKRIAYVDSSSDESDAGPPPKKSIKSETSVAPQRTTLGLNSATNKGPPNRVELPTKPEDKKDTFRRAINETSMVPATDRAVFLPTAGSSGAIMKNPIRVESSSSASCSSVSSSSVTSSIASNPVPLSPPRTLLISSRQVATTTQIISTLQVKHRCATHVCSFDVADFVLSSQLGVVRKLHSEFTNGASRCRLQDLVRRLMALYDKPYLIVEADRSAARDPRFNNGCPLPDASSVIFKPNTPYYLQTLATLAQTDLSVLYSDSQEHTARLLNDLGRQESLRELSLPRIENLNSKQNDILKFLQRIPEINPAVAVLMATQFKSLREILCSSVEVLTQRCKITAGKARNIAQAFRVNQAPSR
ncbi:Fanconi anemia group M protein homolog [Daphnia magna]|uniref:Fanconi anemia group M protein homolog n=1 Tax=Daphnia magna TaxID=35525 RepID=UPI001E1BA0D0|nr:Fanconi anemia group M protein homolog [Daphnia magna]